MQIDKLHYDVRGRAALGAGQRARVAHEIGQAEIKAPRCQDRRGVRIRLVRRKRRRRELGGQPDGVFIRVSERERTAQRAEGRFVRLADRRSGRNKRRIAVLPVLRYRRFSADRQQAAVFDERRRQEPLGHGGQRFQYLRVHRGREILGEL